jgi:hypothetical protein
MEKFTIHSKYKNIKDIETIQEHKIGKQIERHTIS